MRAGLAAEDRHERIYGLQPDGQRRAGRAAAGGAAGGVTGVAGVLTIATTGPVGWAVVGAGVVIGGLFTALYDWISSPTEAHRRNVVQTESNLRQDIARASETALSPLILSIEDESSNFRTIGFEDKHQELHLAALERRLECALTRLGHPSSSTWPVSADETLRSFVSALLRHQNAWVTWKANIQDIERCEQQVRRRVTMSGDLLKGLIGQLNSYSIAISNPLSKAALYRCLLFAHETFYHHVGVDAAVFPPVAPGVHLEEPKP